MVLVGDSGEGVEGPTDKGEALGDDGFDASSLQGSNRVLTG